MKVRNSSQFFGLVLCAIAASWSLNSTAQEKIPTDADQVAGIQKMCADSSPAIRERQAKKSFYERLGKRAKIKTFAQNLLAAHSKNQKIAHMFAHVNKGEFIKNVTDFLVSGSGGKAEYRGKDMAAAHKHLKVTNGDFLAAGSDVQNVMKSMKYGENEIQEMICSLAAFIPVVVVN